MSQSSPLVAPRRLANGLNLPGGIPYQSRSSREPDPKRQCLENVSASSPIRKSSASRDTASADLLSRSPKRSLRVFQPRVNESTAPGRSYDQVSRPAYNTPPTSSYPSSSPAPPPVYRASSPPVSLSHTRPAGRPRGQAPSHSYPSHSRQSSYDYSGPDYTDPRNVPPSIAEKSQRTAQFASEVYSYGRPNNRSTSRFSSTYLASAGFYQTLSEGDKPRVQCLAPILWPTGEYITCDKVMHNAGYLRHLRADHSMMTAKLLEGKSLNQEDAKLYAGPPIWPRVGVEPDQEMVKVGCVSWTTTKGYSCQMTAITDKAKSTCRFCGGMNWKDMRKHFEQEHEEAARQWGLVKEKVDLKPPRRHNTKLIPPKSLTHQFDSSPAKAVGSAPQSSASPEARRLMPPPPPREPLFPITLDPSEDEEDPDDRWLPEDEFLNLNPDSLPLPDFVDPSQLSSDVDETRDGSRERTSVPASDAPTASTELVTSWIEGNPGLFDGMIGIQAQLSTPPLTPSSSGARPASLSRHSSFAGAQHSELQALLSANLIAPSMGDAQYTCLTLLPTFELGADDKLRITTLSECSRVLASQQVLSHFLLHHGKVAKKMGIASQWNGVSELLKRGVVDMTGRWFGCRVVEGSNENGEMMVCAAKGMGLRDLETHLCDRHESVARRFGVGRFEGKLDAELIGERGGTPRS